MPKIINLNIWVFRAGSIPAVIIGKVGADILVRVDVERRGRLAGFAFGWGRDHIGLPGQVLYLGDDPPQCIIIRAVDDAVFPNALLEATQTAANTHLHWKAELARLESRLGRNKAIVAIARKLLVIIWRVLTKNVVDKHADPARVARKYIQYTYYLGKDNHRVR